MSTFSKARVGKKPYFAGSTLLIAKVSGANAGMVGTLPPGAIILGAVATGADIDATISDGSTTATLNTTTASVRVDSDNNSVIVGPGVITITTANPGDLIISYTLNDPRNGDNA